MKEKEKTHTISELGEFGLINHLTKDIKLKNKSKRRIENHRSFVFFPQTKLNT